MVLNIDLAPTFLDIAGVKIPKDMDGVSIMKLFRKTRYGRRAKRYTVHSSHQALTIKIVIQDCCSVSPCKKH